MLPRAYIERFPERAKAAVHFASAFALSEIGPIFQRLDFARAQDLTLFDVGANHGLWSATFLGIAGHKTARVELFEPLPGNVEIIRQRMQEGLFGSDLGKVTLNPFGLSDRAATLPIHHDTDGSAYASMASDTCHLPARNIDLPHQTDVSVRPLDAVCAEKAVTAIDILKIDIEGFELFALQGAEDLFARKAVRICLFEFGPHQLAHRHQFRDFYDFFTGHGYRMYKYRPGGAALIPITGYLSAYEMFDRVAMYMAEAPDGP